MTGQEALDRLREISARWDESGDTEVCHSDADDVLMELLRSLGYNALVDAYDGIGKWYA